ncbi:Inositol monophosphatase family protein [Rhodovulum sp. PH10]|uniref:3'(2'),5'-bisphosphate nucleotidase CysQ n=1 Tax=Rhodovulum sp. PH10 TaxID=1187851 RepID=UPI00027C2B8A|nr:3'(2'),5'-bisphosphate nucleotidase CysQ [Rhodovulum sp. PH10]EJW11183.1 Inositol monophosphatase family protein [Rhodovulum sp. PH10]
MPGSDADERSAVATRLGDLLREAGVLALRGHRHPVRSWFKEADHSPVSEVDLAVDKFLRERLPDLVAGCGWLSEETEDDPARLDCRRVWVVDPIDGTRGFLAGLPDWTISVALVEDGRPVVAALFAPVTDELFLAVAGQGATLDGAPIVVRAAQAGLAGLKGAHVAGPARLVQKLATVEPSVVHEPKVHSLALRLARVAQGRIDVAFANHNAHDWDLAAADLLVHEASGTLTTLAGAPVRYNRPTPTHDALIAADPSRHRTVCDIVAGAAKACC